MNNLRKIFISILMLAVLISCTACSKNSKKKVVIYMSTYKEVAEKIKSKIIEKFPEYDIEYLSAGTGVLQSKILAESQNKKFGCDMMIVAEPSYAMTLKEQGYLEKIDVENKDRLLFDYDKDGYWYPFRALNMVFAYNPNKLSKDDVPKSFAEVAKKDNLNGYISIPDPAISGSALTLYSILNQKYGDNYMQELAKLNPVIESGLVPITKLETGETHFIFGLEDAILKKKKEGSSIEIVYPQDASVIMESPIMTMKADMSANNNIEACKNITNYLLSDEGQNLVINELLLQPVLKNVKGQDEANKRFEQLMDKAVKIDWKKIADERQSLIEKFKAATN